MIPDIPETAPVRLSAPELLKQQMPLVRHVSAELVALGYVVGTKEYAKMFDDSINFYRWMGWSTKNGTQGTERQVITFGITGLESQVQSQNQPFARSQGQGEFMRAKTEQLLGPALEWLIGQIQGTQDVCTDDDLLSAIKVKQLEVASFSGDLSDSQITEIFDLISDMKVYVTSKLGPEVEVPDHLFAHVIDQQAARQESASETPSIERPRG